jgi:hypothetical protein
VLRAVLTGGGLIAFFVKFTAINVPRLTSGPEIATSYSDALGPFATGSSVGKLLLYMGYVKSQAQYIVLLLYSNARCLDLRLSGFVFRVLPVFAGFSRVLFVWFIHSYVGT